MADWFASWFDTKYYHVLYGDRNDQEAKSFIDKLVNELNLSSDQYLLDLCCGKGRHSRYLNQSGFKVKGVDLSPQSIQFAKQFENENLSFMIHDMRDVIEETKFDVVLNLFTSIGYFDELSDNLKVCDSVSKVLDSGGIFLIDFMNSNKVLKNLKEDETKLRDGIEFKIKKKVQDGFIVKSIDFIDDKEYHFEEKVAILDLDFFKSSLNFKGFEVMNVYGSYDLEKFDKETSDRLIIKAVKN